MSTYIDARKPTRHGDYQDCPPPVVRFLYDSEVIRGLSPRTVNGYYVDLRLFFRFLKLHRNLVQPDTPLDEIDVTDIDLAFIKTITTGEIYEFLHYVTRQRENSPAARARKLSTLRVFFKYLSQKMKLIDTNPAEDVDTPAQKKRLPKYLTLQEGMELLQHVESDFYERDYCILVLFLNCGMRISELVNINITDINDDNTLRIIGKGNKERTVYLNQACVTALRRLCDERAKLPNLRDPKALFVSRRTGARLSVRRVQQIVERCLAAAGLAGKGYSPHKLRHTAATLMYQEGHVDMLVLKEILGHSNVATTEIYTHLGSLQLSEAAQASPFANVTPRKKAAVLPPVSDAEPQPNEAEAADALPDDAE